MRMPRDLSANEMLIFVSREDGSSRIPLPTWRLQLCYDVVEKRHLLLVRDDALHLAVSTASEPEVRSAPSLDHVMRHWQREEKLPIIVEIRT